MSGIIMAHAASEGFKNAAAYDAYRPAYPPEAVDKLLGKMGLLFLAGDDEDKDKDDGRGPGSGNNHNSDSTTTSTTTPLRIVEIAAGTGKFTEALVAAATTTGGGGGGGSGTRAHHRRRGEEEKVEVLATEPHPDMLEELEGKQLPGVVVRRGGAEELSRVVFGEEEKNREEEGWADGVIAAQAFHWFATEQVLGEIHKVLKPGGVFGMIWNIDEYNKPKSWKASTQWAQHLNDWIHHLATRDPNKRFRDMAWQDVFLTNQQQQQQQLKTTNNKPDPVSLPKFSVPLGEDAVAWTHWLSEEALWKRINTLSHVALLEEGGAERKAWERVFREAMAMGDVVRNERGEVECHGRTYFAWTSRI